MSKRNVNGQTARRNVKGIVNGQPCYDVLLTASVTTFNNPLLILFPFDSTVINFNIALLDLSLVRHTGVQDWVLQRKKKRLLKSSSMPLIRHDVPTVCPWQSSDWAIQCWTSKMHRTHAKVAQFAALHLDKGCQTRREQLVSIRLFRHIRPLWILFDSKDF